MVLVLVVAVGWSHAAQPVVRDARWARRPGAVVAYDAGGPAGWVVPGPRALDATEFGTPTNPLRTAVPAPHLPEAQQDLVGMVPYLVGVPRPDRAREGERYTRTRAVTPFGDQVRPVDAALHLVARDRRRRDRDRQPFQTPDQAAFVVTFTDPEGRDCEVRLTRVIQPPVPGWETEGGVLVGGWIGGSSGVDSPLAPRTWAFAAVWGLVDLLVDGDVVGRDRLARVAVTEATRATDPRLRASWELPLAPDRAGGGPREASLLVWPVRVRDDGPFFDPLPGLDPDAPYLHLVFGGVRVHPPEVLR